MFSVSLKDTSAELIVPDTKVWAWILQMKDGNKKMYQTEKVIVYSPTHTVGAWAMEQV